MKWSIEELIVRNKQFSQAVGMLFQHLNESRQKLLFQTAWSPASHIWAGLIKLYLLDYIWIDQQSKELFLEVWHLLALWLGEENDIMDLVNICFTIWMQAWEGGGSFAKTLELGLSFLGLASSNCFFSNSSCYSFKINLRETCESIVPIDSYIELWVEYSLDMISVPLQHWRPSFSRKGKDKPVNAVLIL